MLFFFLFLFFENILLLCVDMDNIFYSFVFIRNSLFGLILNILFQTAWQFLRP